MAEKFDSRPVFSAEHDLHNRFAGKIRFWPPGAKKGAKMAKNLCFLNEKKIMPKISEKYVDSLKNEEKNFWPYFDPHFDLKGAKMTKNQCFFIEKQIMQKC